MSALADWAQMASPGHRQIPQPPKSDHNDKTQSKSAPAAASTRVALDPTAPLLADHRQSSILDSSHDPSLLSTNSGGFILASDPGQPHVHNSAEKAELVNLVKKNESSDFPEPRNGIYSNYGLSIYLLEGENAQKALDFAADTKEHETGIACE